MLRHFVRRFLGPLARNVLALSPCMIVSAALRCLILGAVPPLRFPPLKLAAFLAAVLLVAVTPTAHDNQSGTAKALIQTESFDHRQPLPRELFWTRALR